MLQEEMRAGRGRSSSTRRVDAPAIDTGGAKISGPPLVAVVTALFLACSALAASPLAAQEEDAEAPGILAGRVVDVESGRPVTGATVELEGTDLGAFSDADGDYRIRGVSPGTYRLRVSQLGYADKVVTGVAVEPGRTVRLDVSLTTEAVEVGDLVVSVSAERASTGALLNSRRQASALTDGLSLDQIQATPAGTAAGVVRRIPGVTVIGGRFVYVRGLGERYGKTTLNGLPMPTPEIDRKATPLDLIPASFLESAVVTKSYSADLPADYAGGLIDITTRELPERRTFKLSLDGGVETAATGETGLSYRSGGVGAFGFDSPDLPGAVPFDRPVFGSAGLSDGQLEQIGESFLTSSGFGPRPDELPINQGFSLEYGQEVQVADRPLNFFLSARREQEFQFDQNAIERVFSSAGAEEPEVDFQGPVSRNLAETGGLFAADYEISPRQVLRVNVLANKSTEDLARSFTGFNLDSNTDQLNTRLQHISQSILKTSLSGTHLLSGDGGPRLEWAASYGEATRFEPNTREVLFRRAPSGEFLFDTFIQSGSVFFQDMVEDQFSGKLDLTLPLTAKTDLAVGWAGSFRQRAALSRRFRFLPRGALGDSVRALSPNQLFSPENIAPDSLVIQEATFRTDNYNAEESIHAGYLKLNRDLLSWLRFEGGVRFEKADQVVQPVDLFASEIAPLDPGKLDDFDVVPGANLTFEVSDRMNVRLAGSRTLGRPAFRELSPFEFADFAGGFLEQGNPTLTRSRITNLDVRWEWFPAPDAVVAVSGFHKAFDDPIEQIVFPAGELIRTWVNADDADNTGVELELQTGLGFLGSALEDLRIGTNLTLVSSEVTTGDTVSVFLRGQGATELPIESLQRDLQGQSDVVYNLSAEYRVPGLETRVGVLFNYFSDRISAGGGQFLDDIVEDARGQLDFQLRQPLPGRLSLELSGERLTGDEIEFSQGGELLRLFDRGASFSASVGWRPAGSRGGR